MLCDLYWKGTALHNVHGKHLIPTFRKDIEKWVQPYKKPPLRIFVIPFTHLMKSLYLLSCVLVVKKLFKLIIIIEIMSFV